jgi:hypothetical protein
MHKPLVTLENWAVVEREASLRYEDLQPGKHLMGKVEGHRAHSNAEIIYTTPILSVDVNKGRVETRNTVYQLGEPSHASRSWEQTRSARCRLSDLFRP